MADPHVCSSHFPSKAKVNLFAPFAIVSKHICICVGLIRLMIMLFSVCLSEHILVDHVGMIYKHIIKGRGVHRASKEQDIPTCPRRNPCWDGSTGTAVRLRQLTLDLQL